MNKVTLSAKSEAAQEYVKLITTKGGLRASKPKNGNAAYVWRMVGFYVSGDSRMQCMPTTADFGVEVPADYLIEIPAEVLAEKIAKTEEMSKTNYEGNAGYCIREAGSVEAWHRNAWARYDRRKHYIKNVLDKIVDEIVDSVPPSQRAGINRWGRALGYL